MEGHNLSPPTLLKADVLDKVPEGEWIKQGHNSGFKVFKNERIRQLLLPDGAKTIGNGKLTVLNDTGSSNLISTAFKVASNTSEGMVTKFPNEFFFMLIPPGLGWEGDYSFNVPFPPVTMSVQYFVNDIPAPNPKVDLRSGQIVSLKVVTKVKINKPIRDFVLATPMLDGLETTEFFASSGVVSEIEGINEREEPIKIKQVALPKLDPRDREIQLTQKNSIRLVPGELVFSEVRIAYKSEIPFSSLLVAPSGCLTDATEEITVENSEGLPDNWKISCKLKNATELPLEVTGFSLSIDENTVRKDDYIPCVKVDVGSDWSENVSTTAPSVEAIPVFTQEVRYRVISELNERYEGYCSFARHTLKIT